MDAIGWKVRLPVLLLSLAGPLAFPLSQMGYGSLHRLAGVLVLPAAVALLVAWALSRRLGATALACARSRGAAAGAAATLALEAIRYTGFWLGFMPGNLPQLMGVLLLDRFALGPTTASNLAGFAYHFWNGASFGVIFALLVGRRSRWWGIPYGLAIGAGFLSSPVVQALGVGIFGRDFGWHFAATVLSAHIVSGLLPQGQFVSEPPPPPAAIRE
jgi:hypothetical protein